MHVFYTPFIDEQDFILPLEESRHCVNVLRLKKNDKIICVDGKGGYYEAEIIDPNPKKCQFRIISSKKEVERKYHLHLAIAPTKNIERFEFFIEKATEIGIDEITPVSSLNSERKHIRLDRLERIAVAAMKQSIKCKFPRINEMVSLEEFLKRDIKGQKFIAHCHQGIKLTLVSACRPGGNLTVLIGPEGDFDNTEVETAIKQGYREVTLGENRYRTETAAILAVHSIYLLHYVK
ncbi:MAG: 16S rRNA (uracil(1498)-N(3))-methyltransferase [bacterium]